MPRFAVAFLLALPLCAQVKITQQGNEKVSVEIDGKPFTEFIVGAQTYKPHLFPLRAADGTVVTRGYPTIKDVAGEAHDHPHHRGLWFAHGDVNGFDFWSSDPEAPARPEGKKCAIVLERIGKISNGKKSGSVTATFAWKAEGQTLLIETRTMTFYSENPQMRQFDFDSTLSPQTEVRFGDTKEGMFAIRLAPWLEEVQPKAIEAPKRTGKLLNAQNKSSEKNTWGKRSEWVDDSGEIDGKTYGIAVLDHPSNPRHPAYWHVRGYGLLGVNVFGVHDFENSPTRDGSLTIRPGQPLRFRYRVIIHPGDANQAGIRDAWTEWASVK